MKLPEPNIIFIALVTGAFGCGYFVYGKKQKKAIFMISGIILMVYPYFVSSIVPLSLLGVALVVLPFLVK